MKMSTILKTILGEDCDREVKIFDAEEIDGDAFWCLDKETLIELGNHSLLMMLAMLAY